MPRPHVGRQGSSTVAYCGIGDENLKKSPCRCIDRLIIVETEIKSVEKGMDKEWEVELARLE